MSCAPSTCVFNLAPSPCFHLGREAAGIVFVMSPLADTLDVDCSSTLLRVYLFGNHVIPILVFGTWSCSWSHFDRGSSWLCIVHITYCVVSATYSALKFITQARREFCLRHPETRDVCDIGQMLFWDSKIAWYFTAVMFLLNNTFIQVRSLVCPIKIV